MDPFLPEPLSLHQMSIKKKNPDTLVETFSVRPDQGAAAFVAGLSKPGYEFVRMERVGTKVKVHFRRKADS